MAIGGFGMQPMSVSGMPSSSGSGSLSGITDASGGAAAAQAALATAQDKGFADVLQKAYDDGDKEKLKEVCTQFESIMLSMMYKGMKATVPESSFLEESNAREIFDDMLDEELMKRASHRGVGLADMLYRQLSKQMDRTYLPGGADASADRDAGRTLEVDGAEQGNGSIPPAGGTTP